MVSKVSRFVSRLIRTLKAVRQCWLVGGVKAVNIAQVQRGEVLKGKRVLITGGSAGIGLAIAKKCLSEGAIVVITGRSQQRLEFALKELGSSSAHAAQWDVSLISQRAEKHAEVVKLAGGPIDVLVNNAGILGGSRQFVDLTEDTWDELIAVNSKGLVFLTQHVVREWMQLKHCGKIINMSSMRGTLGVQDGPYGMSKWGLNGLTHGLGAKLAPHGIIVNGIAPGIIATDSIAIKNVDVEKNAYLDYIPVKRIGLSEEIAELSVFLMSDAANYIVGQTIVCDGGYTLKA
jgi:3-oxoacyl-[acyl-carrier protein] reductase